MKTIYEFSTLTAYWTGCTKVIDELDGMDSGWTDYPVPEISDGMFARWNFPGWVITTEPPPNLNVLEEPAIASTLIPPAAQTTGTGGPNVVA